MTTRFYLPATATATPITPSADAAWEDVSLLERVTTRTAKISNSLADVAFTDSNNADRDVVFRQYISRILTAGQTVTGSQALKAQCLVSEVAAGNNLFFTVGIRIIALDGSTVRKTVLTVTRDAVEAVTTLVNRQFTATSAATNYTTLAGDRIVIEIGMAGDPIGNNTHSSTMRLGDSSASDLSEDDTSTTDNNPWVELTDTLTFLQPELVADPGSYTITGTAADLQRSVQLVAAPGVYNIFGPLKSFTRGVQLAADAGSYAISGTEVSLEAVRHLELAADPGSYVISGTDAELARHLIFNTELEFPPEIDIYTTFGTAVTFHLGLIFSVDPGSYVLTGTAATFERSLQLAADAGVYAITGTAATLERSLQLAADPGDYAISGTAADLQFSGSAATLNADAGVYTITGASATLDRSLHLAADAGAYAISGTSAALDIIRQVDLDAGVYAISGTAADLQFSGSAATLNADAGVYAISGTDIDLTVSRAIPVDSGVYLITGVEPDLQTGKMLGVDSGFYVLTGTATDLSIGHLIDLSSGIYLISGTAAVLTSSTESQRRSARGWVARQRRKHQVS